LSAARSLLAWYDENRRDLPWRASREPWPVWVSEVMLQQTRVETAIPYFHRFLARFPDPAALAAADTDEVLAAWSGLGYYRRARQLQAAARELVARGGAIPDRAEELSRLPGVGPYTAAAIASIAFGEAAPVLDGNVARLLSRVSAESAPPATAAARRRLLALAATFLEPGRPGDSNQALMELGATVCRPRAPRCPDCPLAPGCNAFAGGAPERYPVAAPEPALERVRQIAAVVERDGAFLLFRRAEDERQMAGLWEFPLVDSRRRDVAAKRLAARFGGAWRLGEPLARLRHAITRRELEIVACRGTRHDDGEELREGPAAGWFTRDRAAELALTGVARKLLARLVGAEA
jgi:A/G-specific adenine glycosylase